VKRRRFFWRPGSRAKSGLFWGPDIRTFTRWLRRNTAVGSFLSCKVICGPIRRSPFAHGEKPPFFKYDALGFNPKTEFLFFEEFRSMPVNPTDAKKLAVDNNTTDLKQMLEKSDELMRILMEAGQMDQAVEAAEESAEVAAALIVRKEGGVRELAKRVRERVAGDEDDEKNEEKPQA
jgi:hypothetical protein